MKELLKAISLPLYFDYYDDGCYSKSRIHDSLLIMVMKEIETAGIRNIIFDLGGVLVTLERQRCVEAFEQVGMEKIAHYVKEGRVEDLFFLAETGAINTHEFCDEVRKLTRNDVPNEDIVWAWNRLLGDFTDDKKEKLLQLKKKYRLFLLSNTNEIHWKHCLEEKLDYQTFGVEDYFEHLFLSYEMRQLKPSPSIFKQVLQDADLKAEETLFIDDSIANCEGARSVGIRAIQETTGRDWMKID